MLSLKNILCSIALVCFFQVSAFASNSFQVSKSSNPRPSLFSKTKENSHYLHDRIIIKLKSTVTLSKGAKIFGLSNVDKVLSEFSTTSVEKMFEETNLSQAKESPLTGVFVAKFTAPVDAFELASEVSQLPEVEYAEPWFIYPVGADSIFRPNDTLYTKGSQWGLGKIKADSAWYHAKGDASVVIGIIDTGVEWDHPDLYGNIWLNPGEDAWSNPNDPSTGNGVDDDGNGFVDDWRGWDFGGASYQNPVADNNPNAKTGNIGHGTHVAGIASASTNNTTGVAGIGFSCKVLPIKTASDNDARGTGGNAFIVFGFQGIKYAADVHADVVNCSWGGAGYSQFEQDVVDYATERGTVVVAAAGNSGLREAQYPAAYRGVFSVGARVNAGTGYELKAGYSTYHTSVDVTAPGGSGSGISEMILSTYVDSSYAYMSGTSMAAPFVAGLIGLTKAKYPDLNSEQAAEQVRVTSDPKENTPNYRYLLGKGRINAYRAVKDSSPVFPSVRLLSYALDDESGGNGNGIPDPGETINLLCTFKNYLRETSPTASVTLVSTDANKIQVINNSFTLGSITTLGTVNNFSIPFTIKIGSSVATNLLHELRFDFKDGTTYSDFQWIELLLNPLFITHKVGNVAFSVSNFGSLGYFDYAQGSGVSYGDGFQYPIGDPSSLFHASLMVATDSNHVVDNAFGNPSNSSAVDWKVAYDGKFSLPQIPGTDQLIQAAYTDSSAGTSRIGLKVRQRSYAYSTFPDNDYIIIQFDIKNIRTDTIKNALVGIYADWDIGDVNENKVRYDGTKNLGYMWDSTGSNYFGISLLTSTVASSFRAVNNPIYVYNGFTEGNKYRFLNEGFVLTEGTPIGDWSFVISAGPFTIPPGDSNKVAFAFLGGDNLSDLKANVDAAKNNWLALTSGLAIPELISPENDSAFLNPSPTLSWESTSLATEYICQVSTDRLFFHKVVDTTVTDTTLQIGPLTDSTRYFWRTRAKNSTSVSLWSEIRSFVLSVPLQKPQITISVLQNPVLTKYFDVIISSHMELIQNPLVQTVSANERDTIDMTEISPQLYKGSSVFKATGSLTLLVYVKATNGQDSAASKTINVGLVKKGEITEIASVDGDARVIFRENTVTEDIYVVVSKETPIKSEKIVSALFTVSPDRKFSKDLSVEFDYSRLIIPKEKVPHLCVYQKKENELVQLESWIDHKSKKIIGKTQQTGTFFLGLSAINVAQILPENYQLYQNYPNPFNPSTKISFDVVQPSHVNIKIYNYLGQLVSTLVDEDFMSGNYNVVWNSKNEGGISMASGVYFCKMVAVNLQTATVEYQQTISMTIIK
ncbi:MAG: S8 family serine peptidase [Ignavibacteriae bacterium]|nr:S8 family serine peptidase [Ignavibacteriota bacterium]